MRAVPKFMKLHRAGDCWRCRGCGDVIAVGARAVGVVGLYGRNSHRGHGAQTIFHPSCVRPWTAENGHRIPLRGQTQPDRAAYLRAWRARRKAATPDQADGATAVPAVGSSTSHEGRA